MWSLVMNVIDGSLDPVVEGVTHMSDAADATVKICGGGAPLGVAGPVVGRPHVDGLDDFCLPFLSSFCCSKAFLSAANSLSLFLRNLH